MRCVVPPAGQTHYIPSLIFSWAVSLVKLGKEKGIVDEVPILLRGISLRWGGRKVRIPPLRRRRD